MNALKIFFHFILITIATVGCSRKDKELTKNKIQESIDKQVLLAKDYLANGNNSQAISLLESLEKKHPDALAVIETLGFIHKDSGNPTVAAGYFEKLINQSTPLHEYKIFAAQAYMEANVYCEACRNYKSYLENFPNDRSTWKLLSQAYELDKNDALALDAYLKVETLATSSLKEKDLLKIAHLYQKTNNYREAKSRYLLVLKHNPQSIEGRVRLLKLEIQTENWDEVQKHLAKLETLPSQKIDPTFIKSIKEILIKKPKSKNPQKEVIVSQAGKISGKSAKNWHEEFLGHMKKQDWASAEQAALEAQKLEPSNILYTLDHLKVVKAKGSDKVLLEELKKAKLQFSNNGDILLALAQTQHKIDGNLQNAKPFYEEFLQQAPNHAKSSQVKKLLTSL